MLTYCLKCKINTENVNSNVLKTTHGRTMSLSRCAICSKIYERTRSKGIIK